MTVMSLSKIIQKGAFVVKREGSTAKIIQFQFNPEKIERTLQLLGVEQKDTTKRLQVFTRDLRTDKYLGESISIELKLDGTHKEKTGETESKGILPILSALEELMDPDAPPYEKTSKGHLSPPRSLPQVTFCWGETKLLPVKITSLKINETEYYPNLIPYRAIVSITMEIVIPYLIDDPADSIISAYNTMRANTKKRAKMYYSETKILNSATSILASFK